MSSTKGHSHGALHRFYWMRQQIYRTGGPGCIARSLDRIAAVQHLAGILSPARAVTLEVAGRRTGQLVPFLVVIAEYDHEWYLVSMLGSDANWVRNVRAAGQVVLARAMRRQPYAVHELPPSMRPPVLKAYLDCFANEVQRFFPRPQGIGRGSVQRSGDAISSVRAPAAG